MKITVYTITDCEFSKQEKDYLTSHSLQFEEKNLETNREFLTEMLTVSNNFAGTPVTKIEKDDGQIAVLKGFTKEEFDQALGFAQAQSASPTTPLPGQPATPGQTPPLPTAPEPAPTPVQDPAQTPATPPSVPPVEPQTPPPVPSTPPQQNPADPQLNSILNDLQAKVNESVPPTQTTPSASTKSGLPNIPEPNFGPQQ